MWFVGPGGFPFWKKKAVLIGVHASAAPQVFLQIDTLEDLPWQFLH